MNPRMGERRQLLWSRVPGRVRRGILVAVAVSLIGWSAAWSQSPPPAPARLPVNPGAVSPDNGTNKTAKDRLREGTDMKEERGCFRFVDERVVFFPSGGDARYIGLENLNLERIVSEITNNPTQLEWTVVGTITEYRGANYLLVRRAVLSRSNSDFDASRALPTAK